MLKRKHEAVSGPPEHLAKKRETRFLSSNGPKNTEDGEYDSEQSEQSNYEDDFEDDSDAEADPSTPDTAPTPTGSRVRPKKFGCNWPGCGKIFNRPSRLDAHTRSHTGERPFKCTWDRCDKAYIEEKHLLSHVKGSHEKERSFVCGWDTCGKAFMTRTRLRRHEATHTEGRDRYPCTKYPPCSQRFRQKSTLERHVRHAHEGKRPFYCKEAGCVEEFDSNGALRRHKEREHGEKKFWCETCRDENGTEMGFVMLSGLQQHTRQEHQNCHFCDHQCRSGYELTQHVLLHHSGQSVSERKLVACPHDGCPKKFTRKSNLTAHTKTAHQQSQFICGQFDMSRSPGLDAWSGPGCDKELSSKARLEDHIRYVHLKLQRPKYSVVEKPKSIFDDLAGVSETSKRCIPCGVPGCPVMFSRNYDQKAHIAAAHGPGDEGLSATNTTEAPVVDPDLDPKLFSGLNGNEEYAETPFFADGAQNSIRSPFSVAHASFDDQPMQLPLGHDSSGQVSSAMVDPSTEAIPDVVDGSLLVEDMNHFQVPGMSEDESHFENLFEQYTKYPEVTHQTHQTRQMEDDGLPVV